MLSRPIDKWKCRKRTGLCDLLDPPLLITKMVVLSNSPYGRELPFVCSSSSEHFFCYSSVVCIDENQVISNRSIHEKKKNMRQNTTANWVNTSIFFAVMSPVVHVPIYTKLSNMYATNELETSTEVWWCERRVILARVWEWRNSICAACFLRSVCTCTWIYRLFGRHAGTHRYKGRVIPYSRIRRKTTIRTSTACERVSTHCISNSWPKYVIGSFPHSVEYLELRCIYIGRFVCGVQMEMARFLEKYLARPRLSIGFVSRREWKKCTKFIIRIHRLTHWTLYQT